MRLDLRCPTKLHGVMVEGSTIEVKCGSRFCGAGGGVVVLHQFDVATGELVATRKFQNPPTSGRNH